MSPNARGEGGGSCGVSANEDGCTVYTGAQLNFGDSILNLCFMPSAKEVKIKRFYMYVPIVFHFKPKNVKQKL
jgi:hypothetical protein